jgi:3-oxoacyl-(acyl-carrier-protein) synthase
VFYLLNITPYVKRDVIDLFHAVWGLGTGRIYCPDPTHLEKDLLLVYLQDKHYSLRVPFQGHLQDEQTSLDDIPYIHFHVTSTQLQLQNPDRNPLKINKTQL